MTAYVTVNNTANIYSIECSIIGGGLLHDALLYSIY